METIPGSIVKAIAEIRASIDAVSKSQYNKHGGYKFAGTDDIYAALTRKMGEVGLCLISLEDNCEIKRFETTDKDGQPKMVQWAHFEFSFVLATADATWTDKRFRRTLYIQITGPQTFQAAQSYAEKSVYRSLFSIPTGDMDLDSMPQADTEDDQVALSGSKAKRKSSSGAKKDGTSELFNDIRAQLVNAHSREHLQHIRTTYAEEWESMPARWHELLEHEYEDRMAFFPVAAE